ncbi:uncharacterized protein [Montipora foliosa]|uniref:uncharacterized protein n=1 Tax=Montipora foliosa TaxID=591990 RepID=UPI0035F11B75
MIWKRAQEACPSIPRPEDENGWYLNDEGILKPKLMTQEIANKYTKKQPELSKALKDNICCEPLPCSVYCLPKDHKKGELKGRPIHAATDTPATPLSTFLVRSLNNILAHVPAHLKNTQEFIDFISSLDDIKGFCSLDVCNLYGSIPLEDLEDGTPGIFTVMRDFFSTRKSATVLEHLSDDDFVSLLRLCITSDVVLIEGNSYSQKSGLAMGNNLAPTLTIIYMNNLDLEIQSSFNNSVHLKRYIDDMFIAWTNDNLTPDEMELVTRVAILFVFSKDGVNCIAIGVVRCVI